MALARTDEGKNREDVLAQVFIKFVQRQLRPHLAKESDAQWQGFKSLLLLKQYSQLQKRYSSIPATRQNRIFSAQIDQRKFGVFSIKPINPIRSRENQLLGKAERLLQFFSNKHQVYFGLDVGRKQTQGQQRLQMNTEVRQQGRFLQQSSMANMVGPDPGSSKNLQLSKSLSRNNLVRVKEITPVRNNVLRLIKIKPVF